MKKSYITPATLVVKLNTTTLLASSEPYVLINSEESVDADKVDVKGYSGHAGSVNWDDDWSN